MIEIKITQQEFDEIITLISDFCKVQLTEQPEKVIFLQELNSKIITQREKQRYAAKKKNENK